MKGQARWSGLVMGFDTHMIAGAVPALRPAQPTQPNITNRSNPHYDETLAGRRRPRPPEHQVLSLCLAARNRRIACVASPNSSTYAPITL